MMDPNEKISITAWTVAHGRTFSDIPFSKEIFTEVQHIGMEGVETAIINELTAIDLAPRFEARYKMINQLLELVSVHQVLEIASGLTPRGLEMTERGIVDVYVEMDLPGIIGTKRKIVEKILHNFGHRNEKLFLEEGNALNLADMRAATQRLIPRMPIGIVAEGFLRYLGFEEKATVARNIRSLLTTFDGAWVTTDITLKSAQGHEQEKVRTGYVQHIVGIDMEENKFENTGAAEKFFEDLGFTVERHTLEEIADQLVSPERLGISLSEIRSRLSRSSAFVMRVNR